VLELGATSRTTLVTCESTAYFDADAGAAVWRLIHDQQALGRALVQVAQQRLAISGRRKVWYEMMKRGKVVHGLTPKPRSSRRRQTKSRL